MTVGGETHLATEELSALVEGELDERAAAAARAHLEGCARCQAERATLERAVRALSGLSRLPAPDRFGEGVVERIHRRSRGRFFGPSTRLDRVPWQALTVAVLVALVAIYVVAQLASGGRLDEVLGR